MESSGSNDLYSTGKQKQVSHSYEEIIIQYPKIYKWFNTVPSSNLSDTGYRNMAARFGMPEEELRSILNVLKKGEIND